MEHINHPAEIQRLINAAIFLAARGEREYECLEEARYRLDHSDELPLEDLPALRRDVAKAKHRLARIDQLFSRFPAWIRRDIGYYRYAGRECLYSKVTLDHLALTNSVDVEDVRTAVKSGKLHDWTPLDSIGTSRN